MDREDAGVTRGPAISAAIPVEEMDPITRIDHDDKARRFERHIRVRHGGQRQLHGP